VKNFNFDIDIWSPWPWGPSPC